MKEIYRKIKKFIQRGQRGWSDEDTWSLDEYLAKVISETTKHLAKNTCSFPTELTPQRWVKILKRISKDIIAPTVLDDKAETVKNYGKKSLVAYEKRKDALKLLTCYFNDLWD